MQPTLNQIIDWARQSGEILHSGFRQKIAVYHKGATDLVTEMDHRSEEYLLGQIRGAFPDHAIYAEESGHSGENKRHQWFVDPLDGTVNYAHGIPIWNVSIAYALDGEVQLGVVYDPSHEEMYAAERGKGATLNGSPIRPAQAERMIDALLVTGFPYTIAAPGQVDPLEMFSRFARVGQGMRRLGSAALDLCYIAEGRLDGYWEVGLHPYDIAAGTLICREAGGTVTRLDGSLDVLTAPCDVVAANPMLHPLMLDVIQRS